jgi:DNA-binding Lrp family transcriptional regulator
VSQLDDIDHAILGALVADGRRTLGSIGEEVGLSAPAVKRRVDKLVARKVIVGFTAIVDRAVLGRSIEAFVELHTSGVVSIEEMRAALGSIADIVEASSVTGRADTIVRITAADITRLETAVRRLRDIRGVNQTETNIVLSRLIDRAVPAPAPGRR